MEDMGSQFFTGFLLRETRATFGGKGGKLGKSAQAWEGGGQRAKKLLRLVSVLKKTY